MTDHLPPDVIRELDHILEPVWAEEMESRRATDERLRKAQEAMASTEELLAEMKDAETDRLAEELVAWDQFWSNLWGDDPPDLRRDGC